MYCQCDCDRTQCADCRCGCMSDPVHIGDRMMVQEDWKAKIEMLESEIHRYEDIIDKLELGSDSDVIRLIQQLHEKNRRNASNGTDSRRAQDDKGS